MGRKRFSATDYEAVKAYVQCGGIGAAADEMGCTEDEIEKSLKRYNTKAAQKRQTCKNGLQNYGLSQCDFLDDREPFR